MPIKGGEVQQEGGYREILVRKLKEEQERESCNRAMCQRVFSL